MKGWDDKGCAIFHVFDTVAEAHLSPFHEYHLNNYLFWFECEQTATTRENIGSDFDWNSLITTSFTHIIGLVSHQRKTSDGLYAESSALHKSY